MEQMGLFDAMRTQPSARGYTDAPVSDEDVMTMLEAASWAPNAQNRQLWEFVVVRKPELKKELADIYRKSMALIVDSIPRAEGDTSSGSAKVGSSTSAPRRRR